MTKREQERSDHLLSEIGLALAEFMVEHVQISESELSFKERLALGHGGAMWRVLMDAERAYHVHMDDNWMTVSKAIECGVLDENGQRATC